MSKTPMKLALDALLVELQNYDGPVPHIDCAITALREALAQPQQAPKFLYDEEEGLLHDPRGDAPTGCIPLYTSPPARKPLTDEEITAISKQVSEGGPKDSIDRFARAVEAAHGIKDTP